ncbi:FAD dependent oxidoreductase [Pyrolobus fumarii 1A]|uniref:FAD dependent oxidoreductase n=1 Tax=Pyrolobus fumarii (strain DSM 11204 / 1A) TaxID=694429 RepID=G0EE66_PYRF1|nr:NAD(P)/FAD-dependent oxidoreductase [Pyrolobus fumarii]AEM38760.1 FAD dependent oxidoreductase [Pyrolobus fumarii 1A]
MREYDVAIIGAGPAGLFAALTIAEGSKGKARIAVFDIGGPVEHRRCPLTNSKIGKCTYCRPCHVLHGVGGAGTLSSGIINLRPDIGGDLDKLLGSWEEAASLIKLVDAVFLRFGAPRERLFKPDPDRAAELERKAARAGAKFIPAVQRHMGSDNTPRVIKAMQDYLAAKGVRFILYTEVETLHKTNGGFLLETSRGQFRAQYVILAPGRSGAEWFAREARRIGVEVEPGPLDVGVRVEVPYTVYEPLTSVVMDPKIIIYTKTYDDRVRTFCTNPRGFVVKEVYPDGTVGVNGETYAARKSMNTNFAFLVTIRLTDPMEDTIEYGKSIARMATRLGGGRPLIQRLGDLEAGRRSTWQRIERSIVEPTLRDVTPGDIGMALPYRVVLDIIEGLHKLDDIAPGVAHPHTLIYAPEIKFYSVRAVTTNKYLETTVDGLFAAGDGTGLSRGINVAAATGILAGRGVLAKMGFEPENAPHDGGLLEQLDYEIM